MANVPVAAPLHLNVGGGAPPNQAVATHAVPCAAIVICSIFELVSITYRFAFDHPIDAGNASGSAFALMVATLVIDSLTVVVLVYYLYVDSSKPFYASVFFAWTFVLTAFLFGVNMLQLLGPVYESSRSHGVMQLVHNLLLLLSMHIYSLTPRPHRVRYVLGVVWAVVVAFVAFINTAEEGKHHKLTVDTASSAVETIVMFELLHLIVFMPQSEWSRVTSDPGLDITVENPVELTEKYIALCFTTSATRDDTHIKRQAQAQAEKEAEERARDQGLPAAGRPEVPEDVDPFKIIFLFAWFIGNSALVISRTVTSHLSLVPNAARLVYVNDTNGTPVPTCEETQATQQFEFEYNPNRYLAIAQMTWNGIMLAIVVTKLLKTHWKTCLMLDPQAEPLVGGAAIPDLLPGSWEFRCSAKDFFVHHFFTLCALILLILVDFAVVHEHKTPAVTMLFGNIFLFLVIVLLSSLNASRPFFLLASAVLFLIVVQMFVRVQFSSVTSGFGGSDQKWFYLHEAVEALVLVECLHGVVGAAVASH